MTKTASPPGSTNHQHICMEAESSSYTEKAGIELDETIVQKLTSEIFRMKDRNDRIKEIRKKLQAGIYHLTGEEIAEGMIRRIQEEHWGEYQQNAASPLFS